MSEGEGQRTYGVEQTPRAEKDLRKLPPRIQRRILEAILTLADEPRPPGCVNLRGREGYRIRVGDYRAVYEVDDAALVVTVFGVGHRKDIYRRG